MTSSAASDTDSARKRTGFSASPINGAQRRRTSTPPPPGRCTSSSTTSGRVAVMTVTAWSTSAASPTTSTPVTSVRPISACTPVRNIRWSSTSTTRTRRPLAPLARAGLRSRTGACRLGRLVTHDVVSALSISSSTSVPPSGTARSRAVPPLRCIRPMIDSRTPIRSAGTESRSKPGPRSRTDTKTVLALDLGEDLHGAALATVLGGVHHCFPRGLHLCGQLLVERAVADHDDLDGHAVLVLDLGGRLRRTASARVSGSSSSSLPVPSGL